MANRIYSDQERQHALEIYVEHGPAEAARQTGIRRATISMRANRAGVTVTRAKNVREATEAAKAAAEEKREAMRLRMIDEWFGIMDRLHEQHQDFVGKDGDEVHYDRAPAEAVKHYVWSCATLLDKIRLEEGKATDRTEHMTQTDFDREVAELVEKVRQQA